MFDIDFIYKKDSQVLKKILAFKEKDSSLQVDTYPDTLFVPNEKIPANKNKCPTSLKNIILIEETDSFLSTEEIFDKITELCNPNPVIIILTENHNFYNVVQWVRKGATDVILTNSLTEKGLFNSILSGKSYLRSHMGTIENMKDEDNDEQEQTNFEEQRIKIPKSQNWTEIADNPNFEMTLAMISFSFDNAKKRFDSDYLDKLHEAAKSEISRLSQYFGGILWFWNGNTGAIAFHFEDHINLAVTACFHLINRLVLSYTEKLNIQEIPSFRISMHTGVDNFRMNNTEDINSKMINFTSHLLNKYTEDNTLCISDDVYNKLSARFSGYFKNFGEFEEHRIYKY